ncbi:WD40 repeat domain-containing protein [Marinobacter halodurans]|uniref:WD40 repeat domain-containing protein n=1 Tax=Marinobacter halodurans TaxID=2528979 RepID=A0ABY1ZGH4_9GAMM|nr:WD40 repeat domain-containing protein [Marinobacter halodurans]TBW51245.1 WD40 repeat domain-containing protein [Marinobacter halodurans]
MISILDLTSRRSNPHITMHILAWSEIGLKTLEWTRQWKRIIAFIASMAMLATTSGCALATYSGLSCCTFGPVMAADVSDDGQYALTSHRDNALVLWNLKTHEYRQLQDNANIYSAAFVPDSHQIMWQGLDNVVHVQNLDGSGVQQFQLPVATYGHLIDRDLGHYYYSDQDWGLYQRDASGNTRILKGPDDKAFIGFHKLLNLSMDTKGQHLLTAGWGEAKAYEKPYYRSIEALHAKHADYQNLNYVALWDLQTGSPVAKFNGFDAKTHATLSPDGQWVVGSDESGKAFYWNTDEPEIRHRMAGYYGGIFIENTGYELGDPRNRDTSGLIDAPPGAQDITLANTFIDHSDYFLRFGNNSHIVSLFKTGNPWPQAYFDLGESPELVTYGSHYSRNTAIATSPQAGVLVIGHNDDGGISVYHFDGEKQTLKRTWVVE